MTQRAHKIVSLFQELTLAELWTVVNAALARIHVQTAEPDISEAIKDQVREDSQLYKTGQLKTYSVDEVIADIKTHL